MNRESGWVRFVFFQVVIVVPDAIDHAAVAFESENRGTRNAIQEIAIMTHHDDAAAEGDERFLEQA